MLSKVTLKNTDLSVSQFCYGTNMLGTAIDQGRANAILDRFAELGGNFVDTARSYGDWIPDAPKGASERALGAWLKGRPSEGLVVATKGGFMDLRAGDWANRCTPECITKDLSESLGHLGVDQIDLYWLHGDNPEAPVQPIVDILIEHQSAGRIRHFGASNWSAERIAAANAYAASGGKPGFVAAQTFWGLGVPETGAAAQQGYVHYYEGEYEELHAEGLPIVAYGAQSGGYFSKLELGEGAVPDALSARYAKPANGRRFVVARRLAEEHGVTLNEVVLSYIASQPNQTIPIFGGSSPEQVEKSVKAASLKLSRDELAELRSA